MSRTLLVILLMAVLGAGVTLLVLNASPGDESDTTLVPQQATTATEAVTVVTDELAVPWGIAFLPGGDLLVTERGGRLLRITQNGSVVEIAQGIGTEVGEGGLLGIALHPKFSENRWLYLYLTEETTDGMENMVVRYRFVDDALTNQITILEDIPGARYHDGGRIAFGPDGYLYIAVGDAGNERAAQSTDSLAGSILRLTETGAVPPGNPFSNPVYSYGHRNPQGLTWDDAGRLWSTEHGRSGLRSGFDEINVIEPGGNYGWPDSQGDSVRVGTIPPALHSGARTTWAPASAAFHEGSIYFGGLRGETLYEAVITKGEVSALREHFAHTYGRIRTVAVGPDGFLYVMTSNQDGRGTSQARGDVLLRIDLSQLE